MTDPPRPLAPDLTPRQQDVARLVASGLTDKQIAGQLGVSDRRVRVLVVSVAYVLHIPGGHNTRVLIARWWMRHHPTGVPNSELAEPA